MRVILHYSLNNDKFQQWEGHYVLNYCITYTEMEQACTSSSEPANDKRLPAPANAIQKASKLVRKITFNSSKLKETAQTEFQQTRPQTPIHVYQNLACNSTASECSENSNTLTVRSISNSSPPPPFTTIPPMIFENNERGNSKKNKKLLAQYCLNGHEIYTSIERLTEYVKEKNPQIKIAFCGSPQMEPFIESPFLYQDGIKMFNIIASAACDHHNIMYIPINLPPNATMVAKGGVWLSPIGMLYCILNIQLNLLSRESPRTVVNQIKCAHLFDAFNFILSFGFFTGIDSKTLKRTAKQIPPNAHCDVSVSSGTLQRSVRRLLFIDRNGLYLTGIPLAKIHPILQTKVICYCALTCQNSFDHVHKYFVANPGIENQLEEIIICGGTLSAVDMNDAIQITKTNDKYLAHEINV